MLLAAHQPAYIPWLGYLHKVASADVFIYMDDLQYEAQNFQNRNRLKLATGAAWLTVPLCAGAQAEPICAKRILADTNPREHWQRRTWQTILHAYSRAPYFARYAAAVEDIYQRSWTHLVDLNWHILELACTWLGIETRLVRASSLGAEGQRSARIVDVCRRVGASAYLSGAGGSRQYLELPLFDRAGLLVRWQDFAHPTYPQRFPKAGFVSHLGFWDLLFNCGPDSRALVLPQRGAA